MASFFLCPYMASRVCVCVCVCVCGEREKGREGGREWGGGRLFGVSSNEDTIPMMGPHLYDLI